MDQIREFARSDQHIRQAGAGNFLTANFHLKRNAGHIAD